MSEETKTTSLTPEMEEVINKSIGGTVANMITARLSTFEKKLHEKLGATMSETLSKALEDKLKDFKPSEPDDKAPDGKTKKNVELETLRKNVETMQSQLQEERTARQQAEKKNRDAILQTSVTEALASIAQITGTPAKMALAALTSMGRIGYDDDGESPDRIVFRGDDGVSVDLPTGLKQWAKSEEAKIFQPATGARGGSGARPGGFVAGPNGQKPTKEQQAAMLNELLDRSL